jgi:hypothetical protein
MCISNICIVHYHLTLCVTHINDTSCNVGNMSCIINTITIYQMSSFLENLDSHQPIVNKIRLISLKKLSR